MINLNIIKNQKLSKHRVVEILFFAFPLSFIIGNLVLSLHLLLFLIFSFLLIKKEKLSFKLENVHWVLIVFFLYFVISTIIQYQSPGILNEKIQSLSFEEHPIVKSFFLFRFLLFIIVIHILFLNKILDLKKILLFSLICTSFVSFDVIFQYLVGFDLFGLKSHGLKNPGPFGDEEIAGAYLLKFSFFSFFFFFNYIQNKKYEKLFSISFIVFHLLAILVAGNRMPLVLVFFGCGAIILFVKNFRFVMFSSLIIFVSLFSILVKYDSGLKNSYSSFIAEVNILKLINLNESKIEQKIERVEKDSNNQKKEWSEGILKKNWEGIILLDNSGYNRIFRTSIAMWQEKPLFGFGLKSFRFKCWEILNKKAHLVPESNIAKFSCANHPHNYYFELLSEAGIIGLGLILIIFFILLKNSFYFIKKYNQKLETNTFFLLAIIISVFIEIWPLRSTGSFFTTANATYFWLIAGVLISAIKKKI